MKCTKCGTINDAEAVYCGNCGEFILENKKLCFNCQEVVELKTEYCPKCRSFIKTGFTLCRKCGKENSLEYKYCTKCKTKLKSKTEILSSILFYSIIIYILLQLIGFLSMFIKTEVGEDGPVVFANILNNDFLFAYIILFSLIVLVMAGFLSYQYKITKKNREIGTHRLSKKQSIYIVFVYVLFIGVVTAMFFLDIVLFYDPYIVLVNGVTSTYSVEYIGLQLYKMIVSFTLMFVLPAIGLFLYFYRLIKNNIKY